MAQKKYPELFERIKQFTTLVACKTFMLPEAQAKDYIRRETHNRYRFCCRLVTKGYFTLEDMINQFPLD